MTRCPPTSGVAHRLDGAEYDGDKRIRTGFPPDWKIADKTGSGDYGRTNDVAVVWSPSGASYVVAIYSDCVTGGYDAPFNDAIVAAAATIVASALPGQRK